MSTLVIASNRGPVSFTEVEGRRTSSRGAGGLVSALSALPSLGGQSIWICSAMTDEDRAVAESAAGQPFEVPDYAGGSVKVRMLTHDVATYQGAHHGFSNSLLWFLQHQLWGWGSDPTIGPAGYAAFADYERLNDSFATAVIEELDRLGGEAAPIVMLQDYHLYLAAAQIRAARPESVIESFVHIPWPPSDAWRTLPNAVVRALLEGLLGCDVVAFHTEHYARQFVQTCEAYLGLPRDSSLTLTAGDGRSVRVAWYPISVDVDTLSAVSRQGQTRQERELLLQQRPEKLIVRVDRADPSKNIYRGFQAYQLMLDLHPEWVGRVSFLALVQPSRSSLAIYVDYLEQIEQIAGEINARFATPDWTPVQLVIGESLSRAVAAYQEYDVLFVNPVADGLNLVAKEGVVVNERDGVLVLSEPAGVYEEIGAFTIGVNPFDVLDQADALDRALRMEEEERRARAMACREIVLRNNLDRWLGEQLADLERVRTQQPVTSDVSQIA